MIFTEVLVVDAFNKTPVGTSTQDYYSFYLSFIILDPSSTQVYSSYSYAQNGTAAFTYKVPEDVVGGDYILSVGNSYQVAPSSKLVRIADYPRDQLQLIATLPQDSYNPGDTVTGQLVANTMDGSAFNSTPSYSLQVSFDTEEGDATATVVIQQDAQPLDGQGIGFFSFQIPSNTTTLLTSVALLVTYESVEQSTAVNLVITQQDLMVVDFYTETQGPLVANVTNKVYFQGWATQDRADTYDVVGANLVAETASGTIVLVRNVSSLHRGKGSFSFVHSENYLRVYLEFVVGASSTTPATIQRDLDVSGYLYLAAASMPYIYNLNNEVTFSVINKNKVILPGKPVTVMFQTNSLLNTSDHYFLQLKQKE